MSDYKMRVVYWPNLGEKILDKHVGHVSVLIEKPDGTTEGPIGFGPANLGNKKEAVFGGPGMVRDDSGYANTGNGQSIVSDPVSLTPKEYGKVKTYIDEVRANPQDYMAQSHGEDPSTKSCIDFTDGVLSAAGKKEKAHDLFLRPDN